MRWVFGIIVAVLVGGVAGWQGALVGFVVGAILGAWMFPKSQKKAPPPMRPKEALRTQPVRNPAPATREPGFSIEVSMGTDAPIERRTGRSDAKLTWYPAGQPVSHEGLRIGSGMIYA